MLYYPTYCMVDYGKAQSAINSGMHPKRDFDVVKQPGTKGYAADGIYGNSYSKGGGWPTHPCFHTRNGIAGRQRHRGRKVRNRDIGIGNRQKTKDKRQKQLNVGKHDDFKYAVRYERLDHAVNDILGTRIQRTPTEPAELCVGWFEPFRTTAMEPFNVI